MPKLAKLLLLLIGISMLYGCDTPPGRLSAKAFSKEWPSREELYRTYRSRRAVTIIYGTAEQELAEAYRTWAESVRQRSERTDVRVISDTAVSREILTNEIILVAGTPKSNRITGQLSQHLPISWNENQLLFDTFSLEDTSIVFSLSFFPNPFNRQMPLLFLTGLSDQAILDMLREQDYSGWSTFPWARWGYAAYRRGQRILMGNFEDSTWSATPELRFDYTTPVELVYQTEHYRFWSHENTWSEPALRELAAHNEENLRRIASFVEQDIAVSPINHYLYPSAERKGLQLNNTNQTHVDHREGSIHTVFSDIYQGHFNGKGNELILRRLLGQPRTQLLEQGLAVYFSKGWQKRGYRLWAQALHAADGLLPLSTLTDNDALAENSRLLTACLAASFVEFLMEQWGKEVFLQRYAQWMPRSDQLARMESKWIAYLDRQKTTVATIKKESSQLPFLRGFNFTHEGYQIYNGYGSERAHKALQQLRSMQVNAVSIVPYTGLRDPRRATPISVSDHAGTENDEAVIHTIHSAHREGMKTMVKPQIWIGGGSWPGDIEMQSDAEWRQFFDYYRRWIFHYAMLSEIHEVDLFCIGTELSQATLQRPDDWRRLIKDIRQLYSGPLTYAANWGEEFEQLTFWQDLDFIGLNCYYPISDQPKADKAALRNGFREITTRIRKVADREQKPLLTTEIGFSSVEAPWILPYSDGRDRPAGADEEHQRLCYEVVLESIEENPWCDGIFWWKWPSDSEERARRNGKSFMPNGKPAAAVVADFYRRFEARAKSPAR